MARTAAQIQDRINYYQHLATTAKRPRLQADARKWVAYFKHELVLQEAYEARLQREASLEAHVQRQYTLAKAAGKAPNLGRWMCQRCGNVGLAEHRFCDQCGTERPADVLH